MGVTGIGISEAMKNAHFSWRLHVSGSGQARSLALSALVFVLCSSTALAGREHSAPPPGDPCLTNRFGRSWSEPIYSGYLFVDGRYIDAPYVVEQRGYILLVNGVRTEPGADIRRVLPPPPPAPPPANPKDPGAPTDLTRESSLVEVLMHPVVGAKQRYWSNTGFYGEERVKATIEYLEAIPSVARVEDTGEEVLRNQRSITIYDHHGRRIGLNVPLGPLPPPPPKPTEEELHKVIIDMRRLMETRLKQNGAVFINGNQLRATYPGVKANARWQDIFRTFASDASLEDKVERLKALGFLPDHKTVETSTAFYPVKDFKASDQIWNRLSGDKTWGDGRDEVLHNMTNGWKRIPPKFERPQTVEVIEPPSLEPKPTPPIAIETPQAVPPNSDTDTQVTEAPPHPRSHWRLAVAVVAGAAGAILFGLLLMRRRR